MDGKPRFGLGTVKDLAGELLPHFLSCCSRVKVAGSVRRGRPEVGDLELLCIPRENKVDSGDLFGTTNLVSALDLKLEQLDLEGILEPRRNSLGRKMMGPQNKLLRHIPTGIPVDVFVANEENWWNLLVCRTGPAESNQQIATRANDRGLKWEPYSSGFLVTESGRFVVRHGGKVYEAGSGLRMKCESEAEVFQAVGMPIPAWADK